MDKMKNFQVKKLSRDEAKNVLGGTKNPKDDCPAGTHEFICLFGTTGVGTLRYCVSNTEPDPVCPGPA